VDASIVRMVLVPATMKLLGDANWWLPGWLDRRLPTIDTEGEAGLPEPEMGADLDPVPAEDDRKSPCVPRAKPGSTVCLVGGSVALWCPDRVH
jgi:hypothetical protein